MSSTSLWLQRFVTLRAPLQYPSRWRTIPSSRTPLFLCAVQCCVTNCRFVVCSPRPPHKLWWVQTWMPRLPCLVFLSFCTSLFVLRTVHAKPSCLTYALCVTPYWSSSKLLHVLFGNDIFRLVEWQFVGLSRFQYLCICVIVVISFVTGTETLFFVSLPTICYVTRIVWGRKKIKFVTVFSF